MSNYNYNTLCHHGIKGQKWGIRRFQNEDGTLTAEGKKRYGVDESGKMSKQGKKLYKKELNETEWAEAKKRNPLDKTNVIIDALRGFGIGAIIGEAESKIEGDSFEKSLKKAAIYGVLSMPIYAATGALAERSRNNRIEKGRNYIENNMNAPIKSYKDEYHKI